MADVSGYIVGSGEAIIVTLPTVRAPEMPTFDDIADDDIWIGWDKSENKSKTATTSKLREKFIGNATPETPVLQNGVFEYAVPEAQNGSTRLDIASLAGKNFEFTRRGFGTYATDEFDILSTGGVETLIDGDAFYTGDRLFFRVVELAGGGPVPGDSGGKSFITGIKTIDMDTTLIKGDMGNLFNVAGGSNKVVLTLPDVTVIDENTTVPIETVVNNQYQTTIKAAAGQNIYFLGTSKSQVYMGKSEVLWLISGSDGWYVYNSYGYFLDVGHPVFGYASTLNTVIGMGQELQRSAYPRLWEYAQTLGDSLVDDTTWNSSINYCGCYSTGNGTTTFRVPDLRGTYPRFFDSGRGLDISSRAYNKPGGYSPDAVGPHKHPYVDTGKLNAGSANFTGGGTWNAGEFTRETDENAGEGSGPENTVKDIGFIGLIKC